MGLDNVIPVPASVPGDFTVRLGDVMPGWVQQGLEEEFGGFGGAAAAAQGFLSWIHWVEVEVQGYEELLEGLSRLKGGLMADATSAVGGCWDGAGRVVWPVHVQRPHGGGRGKSSTAWSETLLRRPIIFDDETKRDITFEPDRVVHCSFQWTRERIGKAPQG